MADRDLTAEEQDALELHRMQALAIHAGDFLDLAKNAARDAMLAHRPHDARIHRFRAQTFARGALKLLEEI